MICTFSKNTINTEVCDGFINVGKYHLFSVFSDEKLIGEFYYNTKDSFFRYEDKQIRMAYAGNRLFRDMSLIDQSTNAIIGSYPGTGWHAVGWQDAILLEDMKYRFRRIKPMVEASFFSRATWGQRRYRLFSSDEEISYSFKLDIPLLQRGSTTLAQPFEGIIEMNGTNKLALLAGFYLIGESLEEEFVRV